MTTLSFEAIGTTWQIDIHHDLPSKEEALVLSRIQERIGLFDQTYSRFRPDSLVSQMAREGGTHTLPDDAAPLFSLYRTFYELTNGKVTPLIGQVLVDAGYDAAYSLKEGVLTQPKPWDEVFTYQAPQLTLKEPALLDFGAAGKGYLVDIVADILRTNGFTEFCVDAGGDIFHETATGNLLRIGLEHPEDTNQAIGIASLGKGSICGSAGNRRTWGKFHHIIDPEALSSPQHIRALWVAAQSALVADGVATALFFTSPETLQPAFSFEYAILNNDFSVNSSPHFPAEFFISS